MTTDGGGGPPESFGHDVAVLDGVQARVIARAALIADKSIVHGGPEAQAKDRDDVALLTER